MKKDFLGATVIKLFMNQPTKEGISILRIINFDEKDNVEQLKDSKAIYTATKTVPVFSIANERKVMKQLIRQCRRQLEAFPRTLKGDESMLEREDLTFNQRNILQVTLEEKKGLMNLIEVAQTLETFLRQKHTDAMEKIISGFSNESNVHPAMIRYYQELLPVYRREMENN